MSDAHAHEPAGRPARLGVGFVIAIVLVAINLRPALTGVGTLLPYIEQDIGLTSSGGGALSTLPLVAFAATSPFVSRIAHRFGSSRVLAASLALLVVGTVMRSLPHIALLFAGTVLIAVAIAFGNVLLPAVIRYRAPAALIQVASAIYVTMMGLSAAVSSGISVPLAAVLPGSWRTALAWSAVLGVIALVVWIPRARRDGRDEAPGTTHAPTPWGSWLAWQVSFYMGLQSLVFYSSIAWLPSVFVEQGMSTAAAGWLMFFFQVISLIASSFLPLFTRGRDDHRWVGAAAPVLIALGAILLICAPQLVIVSCILQGFGGGAALVLALSFQSQRAAGPAEAASLAGMAQGVGYLVAAAGPVLLGVVHDATSEWTLPLVLLTVFALTMAVFGYGAGRDRIVRAR